MDVGFSLSVEFYLFIYFFYMEGDTLTLTRGFSLFGDMRGWIIKVL